jgi:hypothetical protein
MAGSSSGWGGFYSEVYFWPTAVTLVAVAAAAVCPRLNPLWLIAAGGALGACGLI